MVLLPGRKTINKAEKMKSPLLYKMLCINTSNHRLKSGNLYEIQKRSWKYQTLRAEMSGEKIGQ